jgi:tRNA(Arg) A34 adenosine deaminase TadA
MRQAIELMRKAGVVEKTGGPFGCVIVRDGQVLAANLHNSGRSRRCAAREVAMRR